MNELSKLTDEIAGQTTDELRSALTSLLEVTAETLTRMALIVQELERRGEDLSDFKTTLVGNLRKIASGQLSAAAVVRFGGSPLLLNKISQLPIDDQEKLAAGKRIAVAVKAGDTFTERMVDPLDMGRETIGLVFGTDGIRTVSEQIPRIENNDLKPTRKPRAKKRKIWYDSENSVLRVGNYKIPVNEVLAALGDAKFAPPLQESDTEGNRPISILASEHRQIKARSVQLDVPMVDLVRNAFRATGLLTAPKEEEL